MLKKIEMSELQTKVDSEPDEHRELYEHNARLAKFNLKLVDRLAK